MSCFTYVDAFNVVPIKLHASLQKDDHLYASLQMDEGAAQVADMHA